MHARFNASMHAPRGVLAYSSYGAINKERKEKKRVINNKVIRQVASEPAIAR
jgi:hypothetical protein